MVWQSCFGQSRPLTSFKASGVFKSSLVNKAFVGNKGLRPKPLVSAGPGSQCSCPGWGGGERRRGHGKRHSGNLDRKPQVAVGRRPAPPGLSCPELPCCPSASAWFWGVSVCLGFHRSAFGHKLLFKGSEEC